MWPTGAEREPARHTKSSKNWHNCLPETQREKDHRKVQKSMRPEPLEHSFRIRWVMKINISLLPANIPKMLTKRLPKWSRNRYKCVSGRLRKNTPKEDATKMQHLRKRLPKWTPKSLKNRWKNTPGHPRAPLSLAVASLGRLWGYPPHKNTQKSAENMFQSTKTCRKTITPENIP